MGERGHGDDSYLLDNRNRTQKWDEYRGGALDFEVVLSLRAPIFGLFSEKRSVEGPFSQVPRRPPRKLTSQCLLHANMVTFFDY